MELDVALPKFKIVSVNRHKRLAIHFVKGISEPVAFLEPIEEMHLCTNRRNASLNHCVFRFAPDLYNVGSSSQGQCSKYLRTCLSVHCCSYLWQQQLTRPVLKIF